MTCLARIMTRLAGKMTCLARKMTCPVNKMTETLRKRVEIAQKIPLPRAGLAIFPAVLTIFPAVLAIFPAVLGVFPAGRAIFRAGLGIFPSGFAIFPTVIATLPTRFPAFSMGFVVFPTRNTHFPAGIAAPAAHGTGFRAERFPWRGPTGAVGNWWFWFSARRAIRSPSQGHRPWGRCHHKAQAQRADRSSRLGAEDRGCWTDSGRMPTGSRAGRIAPWRRTAGPLGLRGRCVAPPQGRWPWLGERMALRAGRCDHQLATAPGSPAINAARPAASHRPSPSVPKG